jgi:hypothetical protein
LGNAFERFLNEIGKVIHLSIAVFIARHRSQLCARFLRIANHYGRPAIRMKFNCLQSLAGELPRIAEQHLIGQIRYPVNPNEAWLDDDV